jgi:hypothetical protein
VSVAPGPSSPSAGRSSASSTTRIGSTPLLPKRSCSSPGGSTQRES